MKKSDFQDQCIWIIGASSGIGEALALHLDKLGANLILSARTKMTLSKLSQALKSEAKVIDFDVSDQAAFKKAFQTVAKNQIDRIIYLPAVYQPLTTESMEIKQVEYTIQNNLTAVFYLLQEAMPYLKKNAECQLAVTASVAGYVGLPRSQPYACTKAAVINLMESVKSEHPKWDIKLINPGFVKTRLTDQNDFKMPLIQTTQQAAAHIAKGLISKGFEIHFPRRFTQMLKLLRMLPYRFYFRLVSKRIKQS